MIKGFRNFNCFQGQNAIFTFNPFTTKNPDAMNFNSVKSSAEYQKQKLESCNQCPGAL